MTGTLLSFFIFAMYMSKNFINEEDIYLCTLFTMIRFNQEEENIITDFSSYEHDGTIKQIINLDRPASDRKEEEADGIVVVFPNVVFYKKGSDFYWKN